MKCPQRREWLYSLFLVILFTVVLTTSSFAGINSYNKVHDLNESFVEDRHETEPYFNVTSQTLITAGWPVRTCIGDFNNDSLPDLAVASQMENRVEIFFQNVDGRFNAAPDKIIFLSGTPTGMDAGDIDGDLKDDIVVSVASEDVVYLLYQATDFSTGVTKTAFPHPYGVVIEDFDGDGCNDFAIVSTRDFVSNNCTFAVHLYINGFLGDFYSLSDYSSYRSRLLISEDIDSDGKPDLIFADSTFNKITIFKNRIGEGVGDDWEFFQNITSINNPVSMTSAQVDGDGSPEIAIVSRKEGKVYLLRYDEAEQELKVWKPKTGLSSPSTATMIDIVGDFRPDLVVCSLSENRTQVFRTVDGSYSSNPELVFPCHADPIQSLGADMDGDGVEDLVICSNSTQSNGSVTIYYCHESKIGNADHTLVLQAGSGPSIMVAGDFNGDNKMEIGTLLESKGEITFLNDTSILTGAISLMDGPHSILSADLNDGITDLIVSSAMHDTVNIFWGTQDFFNFTSEPLNITTYFHNPNYIISSNVSGGGLSELIAACEGGFQIFLNLENEPFFSVDDSINISVVGANFTMATAADFNIGLENTDQLPQSEDLTFVNSSSSTLEIYFNIGAPKFFLNTNKMVLDPEGGEIIWLAEGLINDDDLPDLAAATADGYITIFFQSENFDRGFDISLSYSFQPPFGISDICLGDIDDDGLDEICVLGSVINIITPYDVSEDSHRALTNLTGGGGSGHIISADFDGDLREDIIHSSYLSDTLSIWYQINQPPLAECEVVTALPLVEGVPVLFSGAGSRDSYSDNASLEYHWYFGDGGEDYGQEVQHVYMDNGTYWVTLRVTDRDGLYNESRIEVQIEDLTPQALFSCPSQAEEGSNISFTDLSVSYPDRIIKWEWEFGDGNTMIIEDGDPNVTHSYMEDRDYYQVNLTVYDDDGSSSRYSRNITINDRAPVADFKINNTSPREGESITFTSKSISYPDSIVNYTWDFGDGRIAFGQEVEHIYLTDRYSPYLVTLTVTDDDGSVAVCQKEIVVENVPPSASFEVSNYEPFEGEELFFMDTSTSYHQIENWTWDFGDGGKAYGPAVSHIYESDGTYTVNLTVTDSDSSTGWFTADIIVQDTAKAAFMWTGDSYVEGEEIQFIDTSSSYHKITEWMWDFGDGGVSEEQNPVHVFQENGTYRVTLTIVDEDGSSSSFSRSIEISDTSPLAQSITTATGTYTFNEDDRIEFHVEYIEGFDQVRKFEWDFHFSTSGPFKVEKVTETNVTQYIYTEEGTYLIAVRIWDLDSYTTVKQLIQVNNVPPVAHITYYNLTNGSISFDASLSWDTESDYPGLEYQWNFGDGGGWTDFSKENRRMIKSYQQEGMYNVSLKVRDDNGEWSIDYIIVYQDRTPPAIEISELPAKADTGKVIEVCLRVTDTVGVERVVLFYKIGNSTSSKAMNMISENLYMAHIPAQESEVNITLWAIAWDMVGNNITTGEFEIQVRTPTNDFEILVAGLLSSSIAFIGGFVYYRNRFAVDEVFIIYRDGCLLAHETRRLKPGMDDDVLSSMLVAIQEFVKDSFKDEDSTSLKRMDFGEKKILIERGDYIYLAVVLNGNGGRRLTRRLRQVLEEIESEYAEVLQNWDGDLDRTRGIKQKSRRVFENDLIRLLKKNRAEGSVAQ